MHEQFSESEIKDLIRRAVHSVEPSANIILYGSRARGDARMRSDYDIAINCNERVSLEKMERIRAAVEEIPILQAVDIVDYSRLSDNFKRVAFQEIEELL